MAQISTDHKENVFKSDAAPSDALRQYQQLYSLFKDRGHHWSPASSMAYVLVLDQLGLEPREMGLVLKEENNLRSRFTHERSSDEPQLLSDEKIDEIHEDYDEPGRDDVEVIELGEQWANETRTELGLPSLPKGSEPLADVIDLTDDERDEYPALDNRQTTDWF